MTNRLANRIITVKILDSKRGTFIILQINKTKLFYKKPILAGILAAAGVLLSVVSIPVGLTKCFPFQPTINVIGGVILGPFWAVCSAFITSLIRNMLGTGSLFAFPGSIFGALFVGITAKFLPQKFKIASFIAEPIGTGIIGAWVSAVILGPIVGGKMGFPILSISFLISSVPGACLGGTILYFLNKHEILKNKDSSKL